MFNIKPSSISALSCLEKTLIINNIKENVFRNAYTVRTQNRNSVKSKNNQASPCRSIKECTLGNSMMSCGTETCDADGDDAYM